MGCVSLDSLHHPALSPIPPPSPGQHVGLLLLLLLTVINSRKRGISLSPADLKHWTQEVR